MYATYAASVSISVLIFINIVTLMLFAYVLWGAPWIGILTNIPLTIVVISALVAVHFRIIGRFQSGDFPSRDARVHTATMLGAPLWVVYLVISIVLLFAGTLMAAR